MWALSAFARQGALRGPLRWFLVVEAGKWTHLLWQVSLNQEAEAICSLPQRLFRLGVRQLERGGGGGAAVGAGAGVGAIALIITPDFVCS